MIDVDPLDVRRARTAPGALREWSDAGVLSAADVHVARRLAALSGEEDELVILGAAFAVRGPRLGHVCVDLETVRTTATVEAEEAVDLSVLPWPDAEEWLARLRASVLVASPDAGDEDVRPLRLSGRLLYLDRYWREEGEVAADLATLTDEPAPGVDADLLADGLTRVFEGETDDPRQRRAAEAAVLRRFAVVAGGPGTGKTTTVARIVALLCEQAAAAGAPAPLVALAAPTGKAAARLEEAVHGEAARLNVAEDIRGQLLALGASTLHRLLGWRPDSHSRFRHDRHNRLPHDVVIVDETSMVSLSLMARLVEAVRPEARLILVGDPGQLTSIEAGAVLGDVVGPASDGARAPGGLGDSIVVLDRVHRFGAGIAALSEAIRRGDDDAAVQALRAGAGDITWIAADAAEAGEEELETVRAGAVGAARAVIDAARAGDAEQALRALGTFRLLCAHRQGPHGVASWMAQVEGWLTEEVPGFGTEGRWYPGRPLLVTENDYGLRLYNGDTGVVVTTDAGRVTAAFERRGAITTYRPARLGAVETVYAMTVHKSQGSQFDTAAVLLPPPASQILTRELLYTAITRAKQHLVLVGTEETVRAAVRRPVARASGLRWRLWGDVS